jgi:hypothetical protein
MEIKVLAANENYVYGKWPIFSLENFINDLIYQNDDFVKFIKLNSSNKEKEFFRIVKDDKKLKDFFVKSIVFIPNFYYSGLGKLIKSFNICRGWLNVYISDGMVKFLAIAENSIEVLNLLSDNILIDKVNFFDFYTENAIKIAIGIGSKNSILLTEGIEKLLLEMVRITKEKSIHFNPMDFFTSELISLILGSSISFFISKEKNYLHVLKNFLKSGVIDLAFSIGTPFGLGFRCGFLSYEIGKLLAKDSKTKIKNLFYLDEDHYNILYKILLENSPKEFLKIYEEMMDIKVIQESDKFYIQEDDKFYWH